MLNIFYRSLQIMNDSAMFILVMLACALAAGRACDVCVSGICQQRRDLLAGFAVTDQMAFDHDSRVLYLQLEHFLNTAVDFNDFKIERVQHMNTSGLTVDQATSSLYTAYETNLYRYCRKNDSLGVVSTAKFHLQPNLMFYKDKLYYTTKNSTGLYYIANNMRRHQFTYLLNYTITDFVVKNNSIYFVSDDKLYMYREKGYHGPELIAEKGYTLSVDKLGDVYLGDATVNGIFKLDESDRLVAYAAYTAGSVDRFVFDHQNNIVFHDAENGSVSYWEPDGTPCDIQPPHEKFIIRNVTNNLCDQQKYEQSTISQNGLDGIISVSMMDKMTTTAD